MKSILIGFIFILFGLTSCSSAYYDSPVKVYYDHVILGEVLTENYVFDGTYSYHILTLTPVNVCWELVPISSNVYLYNSHMEILREFIHWNRIVYYKNNFRHYTNWKNHYRPVPRHDAWIRNNRHSDRFRPSESNRFRPNSPKFPRNNSSNNNFRGGRRK